VSRLGLWLQRDPTMLRLAMHLLAALPLAWLAAAAVLDRLGADPVAALTHETGQWALRLLLISLAMTPLRRLTRWAGWIRYRRMTGLWAFAYASLHLSVYVFLDLGDYWRQVVEDVLKRPYITLGASAWLLLLPLAATSTRWAMRLLGRRWLALHRLVYLAAILAVVHFIWLVKADLSEPLIYAAVLTGLFAIRLMPSPRFAKMSG
jgi:sulfoxide reductase heme-binding subunit YedZ